MSRALELDFQWDRAAEAAFPDDLREWIDPHVLLRLVWVSLRSSEPSAPPDSPATPPAAAAMSLRALAGLITCGYATGRYRSAEIESDALNDPLLRHWCVDQGPDAGGIRFFRRRQRGMIRRSLAEVLRRARRIHDGDDDVFEGETDRFAISTWTGPGPAAGAADPCLTEADARINRAVRLDCWDWDV